MSIDQLNYFNDSNYQETEKQLKAALDKIEKAKRKLKLIKSSVATFSSPVSRNIMAGIQDVLKELE